MNTLDGHFQILILLVHPVYWYVCDNIIMVRHYIIVDMRLHHLVHTVWKLRKFSLTLFWQKFRESNVFTKEITKELISRNFFSVRENFSFFHTVTLWMWTVHLGFFNFLYQNFREIR